MIGEAYTRKMCRNIYQQELLPYTGMLHEIDLGYVLLQQVLFLLVLTFILMSHQDFKNLAAAAKPHKAFSFQSNKNARLNVYRQQSATN